MSENNKVIKNKCDECGGSLSPYTYKGQNSTYLCGGSWHNQGCGNNICFVCGKRKARTEWVEGEDCCGNKKNDWK